MTMTQPWWRGGAMYELYVQSFDDGPGEGLCDLAGVRSIVTGGATAVRELMRVGVDLEE